MLTMGANVHNSIMSYPATKVPKYTLPPHEILAQKLQVRLFIHSFIHEVLYVANRDHLEVVKLN